MGNNFGWAGENFSGSVIFIMYEGEREREENRLGRRKNNRQVRLEESEKGKRMKGENERPGVKGCPMKRVKEFFRVFS